MKNRKDLDIHVLYGGFSSERPGSIMSSITVSNALIKAGYNKVKRRDINQNSVKTLIHEKPDVAYLAFHGGFGEDGTLQGFLELLGIPYTCSGVAASAISADKYLANKFVNSIGYNAPEQIVISDLNEIKKLDVKFPKIIKPIRQGCSYGLFLVNNHNDLNEKAKFSLKFDGQILIEDYIAGREFSIGIFENRKLQPIVLPIIETKLEREIFDYETKYPGGESLYKIILPANLGKEKNAELEKMCLDIFSKLECRGYSMIDIRMDKKGKFYFLENNTIPGMLSASESYIPRMLRHSNIPLEEFVDIIVESALKRHTKENNIPSEKEMVKYLGLKLAGEK